MIRTNILGTKHCSGAGEINIADACWYLIVLENGSLIFKVMATIHCALVVVFCCYINHIYIMLDLVGGIRVRRLTFDSFC